MLKIEESTIIVQGRLAKDTRFRPIFPFFCVKHGFEWQHYVIEAAVFE